MDNNDLSFQDSTEETIIPIIITYSYLACSSFTKLHENLNS